VAVGAEANLSTMLSGIRRLGLVASLVFVVPAAQVWWSELAWADDEDEEEDEDEDEEDEEDEEEDEDQPPVTAGGLFTKETYPVAELARPLTITKGMAELRAGIDVDVSAKTAFEKWGLGFNARYGVEDNLEVQFDLRTDLNKFSSFRAGAAVEGSIVYDLVDFRLGMVVPYTKTVDMATGMETSETAFDFEVGFPFRYAVKPEGGIVALDTFMTINTEGKPDLTPSIGIVVQPVDMLAIKLHGKVIIKDFDTSAENFQIPVSANIQFSPKNLLDIGGEFTFPNLKPPETQDLDGNGEPDKFYDQRMLLLYAQIRI
jgi:hypothetical protein